MKLNDLIEKLVNIRDAKNAGDFDVLTQEVVYDVNCGEIQTVYRDPVLMDDKDIILDENNKVIQFCAQDNGAEC